MMRILLLFLLCIGIQAQNYYLTGNKSDIEKFENVVHKYHSGAETNYKCDKWCLIEKDSLSDTYMIIVSDIDLMNIFIPLTIHVWDKRPAGFTSAVNNKKSSDGRYLLPALVKEETILIKRESDGTPILVDEKTVLITEEKIIK